MFSRAESSAPVFFKMIITNRTSDYRHNITVEKPTRTKDDTGATSVVWSTYCTVMAEIYHAKGKERSSDGKLLSVGTYTIGFRHDSRTAGITHDMRVKHGTRVFDIEEINNVEERNQKFVLSCKEEL